MNEKISPYYNHYLRASMLAVKKGTANKNYAYEECEKAIAINDNKRIRWLQNTISRTFNDYKLFETSLIALIKFGDKQAYALLGGFYLMDNNNEFYNPKKGIQCYKDGIKANSPDCYYQLALCYKNGNGVEKSETKFLELLEQGSKFVNYKTRSSIYYELGGYYEGVKDYKKSLSYYKKSAKYGNGFAYKAIASHYYNGWGVKKNYDKFMDYITMNYNAESNLSIAGVYLLNEIAPQDEDLIEFHLYNSARQGSATGALIYALALTTDKEPKEKEIGQWIEFAFKKASNDEQIKACYDEIENCFGTKFRDQIKDMAEKYWKMKRAEA